MLCQVSQENRKDYPMRHFRKIILLIGLFIFCVSFNSLATEDSKNTQASPRPFENYNIVLIFIDTLRADHLSCYGYFRKTSPNIDQLAKKSVVFEQNFSTVSFTNASFMSIITSLYPKSHGVLYIYKDKLSPRVKTLAEILQMYGYKTAWFGPLNDPHLDPKVGFGRGFDDVFDTFPGFPKQLDKLRTNLCDWLQRNKDRKFFLNFHTYKVHAPYLPSLKYK